MAGYEGTVDGITEIRDCFTSGGEQLGKFSSKYSFQYRIMIAGQALRKIAPAEDLEVLERTSEVCCSNCRSAFQTKPAAIGKTAGRCQCGQWICPSCLRCQQAVPDSTSADVAVCPHERKRLLRKASVQKRFKSQPKSA
jgi:hypothetical protein